MPSKITFGPNGFSFECPHCGKENFRIKPLDHIFILNTTCTFCGERVIVQDSVPRKMNPEDGKL